MEGLPALCAVLRLYRSVVSTPSWITAFFCVGTPSPSNGRPARPRPSEGSSQIVTQGAAIFSPSLPARSENPRWHSSAENTSAKVESSVRAASGEKTTGMAPEGMDAEPTSAAAIWTASRAMTTGSRASNFREKR